MSTVDAGRVWDISQVRTEFDDPGRVWERRQTALAPPRLHRASRSVATLAPTRRPRPGRRTAMIAAIAGLAATALVVPQVAERLDGPTAFAAADTSVYATGSMHRVVDQIGARAMWAQGHTGAGLNVAVIDTGVADVANLSGDGKLAAVVDFTAEADDPGTRFVDGHGHGTHMAGIIAGRTPGADIGTAAEHPDWYVGVAPDAGIVSVKVGDATGTTDLADVITGIDWVVDHADELSIRVINLSFSSGSPLDYTADPLVAATQRAWDAGIVVLAPAGNGGADAAGVDSPANNPYVIAVAGADVSDDRTAVASWSSRGDGVRNPDVAAPGAHIDSLRAPGSDADVHHPEGFVDDHLFRGSGASQATAVTAGGVALLLDANPSWTPDEVKAALAASARPVDGSDARSAGAGFIDLVGAAQADVAGARQDFVRATTSDVVPRRAGVSSVWTGTQWTGTQWTGTQWTGTQWTGTQWTGTQWTGTQWTGTQWTGTQWTGTQWTGTQWTGTQWTGTQWTGTQWTGTQWTGTQWT